MDSAALCMEVSEATLCAVTIATLMKSFSVDKLRTAQESDSWISTCMKKVRPVFDALIEAFSHSNSCFMSVAFASSHPHYGAYWKD